jgi:hypothetical protein
MVCRHIRTRRDRHDDGVDEEAAPGGPSRGRGLPQPFEWLFRNRRTGGLTIAQVPNVPLWVFLGAVLVRAVVDPNGGLRTALDTVAGVALAGWAIDEIVRGVNPWRRILGAGVLVLAAISWTTR